MDDGIKPKVAEAENPGAEQKKEFMVGLGIELRGFASLTFPPHSVLCGGTL